MQEKAIKTTQGEQQADVERGVVTDVIHGVALGAGGKLGLDAGAQISQAVGKLADKVKPKS